MKKEFLFLSLLLLFVCSLTMAATTGKIAGKVTDAETGEALPGVNVIIDGTQMGAATNLKGEFFIINVPPGNYSIKATFIGFNSKSITNVKVSIDRTTTINFELSQTVIAGEEVVVVAGREKIRKDVSYSQRSISAAEIITVPTGTDLRETIAMGVGIQRDLYGHISIRGGEVDEVGFFVDDFSQNDKRLGIPVMQIPKAAIEEIQVLTGGFGAEYGEARSGMINIVTKEGGKTYHGSVDYRMSPVARKHFGPDIFSAENWWQVGRFLTLQPSEDRDGDGNPDFEGWNSFFERNYPSTLGESPEELLEIWKWRHRPLEYGNEADHYVEGTLGGPVPFTGGKLSFFLNSYYDRTLYAFRLSRPAYTDYTGNLKLRYDISKNMTLRFKGNYGETQSCTYDGFAFNEQSLMYVNPHSFDNMAESYSMSQLYNSDSRMPRTNTWRGVGAIDFTHVLNANSFYEIKFQYDQTRYRVHPGPMRDTTPIKIVGNFGLDETPLGFSADKWKDQLNLHRLSEDYGYRDYSWYEAYMVRTDYTNQINTAHQLKLGIGGTLNKMYLAYGRDRWTNWPKYRFDWWTSRPVKYLEGYFYAQDKLEFEGMIMNVGLRLDAFDPNEQTFSETWSHYYTKINYDSLYYAPTEDPKVKWVLSPRLGISHPISDNSKLFFNYGYFFQRADVGKLYQDIRRPTTIFRQMSNPDLDPRKTISYELGVEQNVADWFSYTLSGYYKDVSGEISEVRYIGIKNIDYRRYINNRYKDIRGFELQVDFPQHYYFSGWLNYNYMLTSSGWYGLSQIYEDPLKKNILQSPNQSKPKPRPWFRANIMFSLPEFREVAWYQKALSDLRLSAYIQWRSGEWLTYHSDNYPGTEENNIHWKAWHNVDLNITKGIHVLGLRVFAYAEIHNLLNTKKLSSESGRYDPVEIEPYLDLVKQEGLKPGEFDNPKVQELVDKAKYWALYGAPRDIWLGLRFEF